MFVLVVLFGAVMAAAVWLFALQIAVTAVAFVVMVVVVCPLLLHPPRPFLPYFLLLRLLPSLHLGGLLLLLLRLLLRMLLL